MERLTLRDAAERTGLSVTTLRRYIRSGRLAAAMTPGRYGPEYTVSMQALEQAGAPVRVASGSSGQVAEAESPGASSTALSRASSGAALLPSTSTSPQPDPLLRDMIPIDLFRELTMKHEQLLVQYGMVRVGGQKMLEYKVEAERLAEALNATESAARSERERYAREVGFLKKHLREAELEIEARNQDIAELREKSRMLELVSRNAITSESIERQFLQVFDKRREVDELAATSSDERRRKMAALDEILKSGFHSPQEDEQTDQ